MAGVSGKAYNGVPVNKDKTFQGQRLDDEMGLNWIQFKWRNHDPQIGRFVEIDPISEDYVFNSTYAFSENKVTNHIELEGLEAVSVGDPKQYLMEGFRQIFQAAGNLVSFQAEIHFNKEVEVKTEVKTSAGTVENKTTTTIIENKAELKTNFGDYFKNGGGKIIELYAGSNAMTKVENSTTATINTTGAPIKMSSKITDDKNGRNHTTSAGTGASVPIGDKGKVNISVAGFIKEQQSGINAGQTTYGFKAAVDATFVSKSIPIINSSFLKISTSTQTTLGGSVTQTYKLPK